VFCTTTLMLASNRAAVPETMKAVLTTFKGAAGAS